MGIAYKPEIDGLRAIAVAAVVLYHAGLGGAGYVGVDVFFVISGYLITSLLRQEQLASGDISLASFYARRARRILPACTLVIAASLAAGLFLLAPVQKVQASNSAAAAMVFVANLYFQANTGSYFDAPGEQMPLLHLWSLSVEEQFYVIWPALLLLMWRRKRIADGRWIWVLGLASFCFSQAVIASYPNWSFFQMPARFWELAVGGGLACLPASRQRPWLLNAGLLLLALSLVQRFQPFPALGAVPVVLGSAMVIGALHSNTSNAFLASRPMVALGLLSYSFYLWHWPLLALYRATSIGDGRLEVRLALCGVALLLAAASYRYVEKPFRAMRWAPLRTAWIGGVLAISLAGLFWGAGALPRWKDPFPLAARAEGDIPPMVCHTRTLDRPQPKCLPNAETRLGIWGDSMALSWTPAAWHADSKAVAFTRDACWPVPDFLPEHASSADRSCLAFNREVLNHIYGLDTLVLVAWWRDNPAKVHALGRTLDAVAPRLRSVLIIGPTPTLKDKIGNCIRAGKAAACTISRAQFEREAAPIYANLRILAAAHPNVRVYDPTPYFCDARNCGGLREGVPLYWDSHHVSLEAAREIHLPVSFTH